MSYNEIISSVAKSVGLNKTLVNEIYRGYWEAIRMHISSLPLKSDLTQEEFLKLRPNVNIPSIGKLYVTYDRYKCMRESYEKRKRLKEDNNAEDSKD
jgi:hypothetical protein